MPRLITPLFLTLLLVLMGAGASAQIEGGNRGILPQNNDGLLEVGGIEVDVRGENAQDARLNGWRIAQREGFAKLWAERNRRDPKDAPGLSDSTLDSIVSAIVVEQERIGTTRYIATLGVQFDRARAGEYVGVSGSRRRSAPMLLVPVTIIAGSELAVEQRTPWQRAWANFRTGTSPVDYVRVSGLGGDPLFVNANAARRSDVDWWRATTEFYDAANVVFAEAHLHYLYPGGPAKARFVAYVGIDRDKLGEFTLTASSGGGVQAMMDEGAKRMDSLFARAYRAGNLERESRFLVREPVVEEEEVVVEQAFPPTQYHIQLYTPTPEALAANYGRLRAIGGVSAVNELSIVLGGWSSVLVTYAGDLDGLSAGLRGAGYPVQYAGGVLRLLPPNYTPPSSETPPEDDGDESE